MPENQKDKKDGTVEEDQKERGYYYDDAHGYEEFDPDVEDDDAEVEDSDAESERRGDEGEQDAECERRGDAAMSSLKLPTDHA
jgi:hypothetical protein